MMGTNQSTDAVFKWRLALIVVIGAWILSLVLLLVFGTRQLVRCPRTPIIMECKDDSCTYYMASFVVTAPLMWDGSPNENELGETLLAKQRLSFTTDWGRFIFRSYYDERPDALSVGRKVFLRGLCRGHK